MEKELSIYVHIPFCNSKCYYCNFSSSVESDKTKKEYFCALKNEINIRSKKFSNCVVKTVYFGGGTPSSVNEKEIGKILKQLRSVFVFDKNAEVTIELNPFSTTKEKLLYYKKIGINRLSFGVQSFNKKALLFVGRLKTKFHADRYKKQVLFCLKTAKEVGFNNISCDFILGLPFVKKFQIKSFLKKLSKFVTHFSCYMLQVEEKTKLFSLLKNGADEEKILNEYILAVKVLKKLGFSRYEISNFSRSGFESKHNKVYWNRKNYLGFGLSASSKLNRIRETNTSLLNEYLQFWALNQKSVKDAPILCEDLSPEQEAEETVFLSLRTKQGLNLNEFKKCFYDLEKKKKNQLEKFKNLGLIQIENGFLQLTEKGVLVENSISVELI